jgi:hypothetical protein
VEVREVAAFLLLVLLTELLRLCPVSAVWEWRPHLNLRGAYDASSSGQTIDAVARRSEPGRRAARLLTQSHQNPNPLTFDRDPFGEGGQRSVWVRFLADYVEDGAHRADGARIGLRRFCHGRCPLYAVRGLSVFFRFAHDDELQTAFMALFSLFAQEAHPLPPPAL